MALCGQNKKAVIRITAQKLRPARLSASFFSPLMRRCHASFVKVPGIKPPGAMPADLKWSRRVQVLPCLYAIIPSKSEKSSRKEKFLIGAAEIVLMIFAKTFFTKTLDKRRPACYNATDNEAERPRSHPSAAARRVDTPISPGVGSVVRKTASHDFLFLPALPERRCLLLALEKIC